VAGQRIFSFLAVEVARKHFDKIRGAIRYMTQLLDDTLILGRAEAGRLRVNPQPLNLEQLYQDILGEIQPDAGPGIRFVCHTTGDCSRVLLDDKLLHHILSNLLSNATKYSPRGGSVSTEFRCDDEKTTIRVSDQGIGIPRLDQERLFEPFHRGENVGNIKGTGLGLAIAQTVNLPTAHQCGSKIGVGTTFTVTTNTLGRSPHCLSNHQCSPDQPQVIVQEPASCLTSPYHRR
jgi:signal transduction histidine kinase